MQHTDDSYDVAIIGSGIGGSTLGAILARQGQRVIIFEAGTHPKFAIGESMILETSEILRAMAELYDVPELAYFSSENYAAQIGTSHGVKRHFSYVYHQEGRGHDPRQVLQAVIPKSPHGHELHLHRQDSDYFLTSVAIRYGATVLQGTPVKDIVLGESGVEIVTAQGKRYRASYLADAGGFRSLLAEKLGWRTRDQQAHTRSIFTHMLNVPCYSSVGPSREGHGIPFRLSEGTLHHIFRGGWLWVIPFNNHARATNPLVSVGLQLDPRVHPARPDLTPEQEFFSFVERFPGIAPQFAHARAARGWVRTERLQYSSEHVVGDRFCLLGHAAGFIDPLYSKGLYTTLMSVSMLASLLIGAKRDGDYSAARFMPLEEMTLRYVRAHDRLVANSVASWANYRLWEVYSVLWMLGAYLELVKLISSRAQAKTHDDYFAQAGGLRLVGGGFAEFDALADRIDTIIETTDPDDAPAVDRAVAEIRRLYAGVSWIPLAFKQVLAGKNHLPARKLRLSLLSGDESFFGSGGYRAHFFGDSSLRSAAAFFLRDQLRYSVPALQLRKLADYRHSLGVGSRESGVGVQES